MKVILEKHFGKLNSVALDNTALDFHRVLLFSTLFSYGFISYSFHLPTTSCQTFNGLLPTLSFTLSPFSFLLFFFFFSLFIFHFFRVIFFFALLLLLFCFFYSPFLSIYFLKFLYCFCFIYSQKPIVIFISPKRLLFLISNLK